MVAGGNHRHLPRISNEQADFFFTAPSDSSAASAAFKCQTPTFIPWTRTQRLQKSAERVQPGSPVQSVDGNGPLPFIRIPTHIRRRLKLRCDRHVPCGSCVKRGCGAICPDGMHIWSLPDSRYNCPTTGSLTTGQGNRYAPCHSQIVVGPHTRSRFVLASTAELHEKISDLSVRVRTLEDALKESHALVSHERHPLLTDNLLQIKAPLQRDPAHLRNIPKNEIKQEDQSGEVVDAFGSLSINAFGGANYYGSIANSWVSASHNSIYCPSLFQYSFSSR